MAAEPAEMPQFPRPDARARNWLAVEAELIWFARVEQGLELMRADPRLHWADVAATFECAESTLRLWRRRYWLAKGLKAS